MHLLQDSEATAGVSDGDRDRDESVYCLDEDELPVSANPSWRARIARELLLFLTILGQILFAALLSGSPCHRLLSFKDDDLSTWSDSQRDWGNLSLLTCKEYTSSEVIIVNRKRRAGGGEVKITLGWASDCASQ